ncbi:MAG: M3 family metallopeptidase [Pseudomonadota bacterium]
MTNPLLENWDTPHGVPPFEAILPEHFVPALTEAINQHTAEIDRIATSPLAPTFENTVEALEASGGLLNRIAPVLSVLGSAQANDAIRDVQKEIVPVLTAHHSRIYTRQDLFQRIAAVAESEPVLDEEGQKLLQETHKAFVRAGAGLPANARQRVLEIDETLSRLSTRFGQNIVKDASEFELVLEEEADLAGLPASVRASAALEAEQRGKPGKFVFTISRSSMTPFLQYAERRELREKLWRAYTRCADNSNDYNNRDTAAAIARLRAERAALMGYDSWADYVLADRMAGTPDAVRALLDQIWQPARQKALAEAARLQSCIQAGGGNFKLEAWDWWFYTEKVRTEEFSLDSEKIKPWFLLENVRDGAFDVAHRLFGIRLVPVAGVPVYHEDVQAFEVLDEDDSLVGLFMTDYFMRPGKKPGAWMNAIRPHATLGGKQYPVVYNTCNFPRGNPCLLGMDEVRTLFHEFGHALHGLLSRVRYRSLSGTAVKRDFIELPSQIMEHWATEPLVLHSFARHHETGEPLPDDVISKLLAASTFNQGFKTTEYLAASYLDLAWHSVGVDTVASVESLESEAMAAINLIPEIAPRYHSTYFQHIFSGSYSAGYYSYIWAEVLDADAYDAFRENGIFDQETARSFRSNILERGGTADPMELYCRFRGREPGVMPLLRGRGLAADDPANSVDQNQR